MDYDKLIEQLKQKDGLWCSVPTGENLIADVVTALSTLQAENAQLRADLEYEREHANAYHEECGQWEAENEKLRAELENYRKGHCSEGGCAAERDRDLVIAENKKLRAEMERVKVERDAYQAYFKDLSSKPDCNTCEKRNCDYRPKLGATVRVNCPLYSGPQKEDGQ